MHLRFWMYLHPHCIECVHAWLCTRVYVESHSNSWHAQAPFQNVRNPCSSARVCAHVFLHSATFFLSAPSVIWIQQNHSVSIIFLFLSFIVGQTFDSRCAGFAHQLQLHRSLSCSPSWKVEFEMVDFSLIFRLWDFQGGMFMVPRLWLPTTG